MRKLLLLFSFTILAGTALFGQRTRPRIDQMELSVRDSMMILTLPQGPYTGVQTYVDLDNIRQLIDTDTDTDTRYDNPVYRNDSLCWDIIDVLNGNQILGEQCVDVSSLIDTGSFDTRVDTAYMNGDVLTLEVYNISNGTLVKTLTVDLQQFNDILDSVGVDHDWYEEGTTDAPNSINDSIYTLGYTRIGSNALSSRLDVFRAGSVTIEDGAALWLRGTNSQITSWSLSNNVERWFGTVDAGGEYSLRFRNSTSTLKYPFRVDNTDNITNDALRIKATEILISDYPNSRDDSGTDTPINFLYTDGSGNIRSAPVDEIAGGEWTEEVFASASGNSLTLSATLPTNNAHVVVTMNGVQLTEGGSYDYTVSGTDLNFTFNLASDQIKVRYRD